MNDINVLASCKLTMKNKKLLKNRYKIEFINNRLNKKNKKIINFFIFFILGKYD